MQGKISRRKLAQYCSDRIEHGAALAHLIDELAAYLIESGRIREAELVVRAIEDELAARGTVIARVTTAHPLDDALRADIKRQIGATNVYVDEIIDPSVLGGVRIETPNELLDATMKRNLLALRQAKI